MTKYEAIVLCITGAVIIVGASLFGAGIVFGNGALLSHEDASPPHFGLLPQPYPQEPAPPKRKALETFPDAGATWRDRLPGVDAVPLNSFVVYYLNTERTENWKSLPQHRSDSVDINFAWAFDIATGKEVDMGAPASGTRVDSENFGAYWIGGFSLPSDQKMDLYVTQSWAQTRVIIDGKEVYSKENQDTGEPVPLLIKAGTHTMEVEYTNNWHTTSVSVSLRDASSAPRSQAEVSKLLPAGVPVWQASVYESGASDKSIKLKTAAGVQGPVVLEVNSYDSVNWDLGEMGVPVSAIVVSGYSKGSRVIHVPAGTSVYYSDSTGNYNSHYDEAARYGYVTAYGPKELIFPASK